LSSDRDVAAEDIADRFTEGFGDRVTGLASYPGADVYEGVADESVGWAEVRSPTVRAKMLGILRQVNLRAHRPSLPSTKPPLVALRAIRFKLDTRHTLLLCQKTWLHSTEHHLL
jgi:hypothetical protein